MASKETESIADKLEEISVLIQDATLPYKERPAVKPKVKFATSQKAKIRSKAKDREASLAEAFDEPTRPPSDTIEQIRLEQLKGANLDKQLELAKIEAELARLLEMVIANLGMILTIVPVRQVTPSTRTHNVKFVTMITLSCHAPCVNFR